ncbi:VWA domain-containing protein [Lysobacter auxotrophicus]|uniref:VWA domain-containing protein n=1 Tax=Lysobacter auxotrophicus TaxID=2992573 RepID=A0ABM8DH67_9GAMM|nr:VWA domain-containing protein [Lysobacter auxotrophicus]BDU17928.1 VWA domain-containing protein [Lysobacter auxotrophicus]
MNPFADLSLASLHLLRPQWLWALLALPLLFGLWRVRRRRASVWRENVDAHLLPHLLVERGGARVRWGAWLASLAYVLAVIALAGPSWRQSPQPLWQSRTPLVVAVDLSGAALAADLPPSRLAQSRAKLSTLLRERQGGQVALVAFADDAFTVAPLTEDAANVALFLDALSPDVMPVDGQRADRAIGGAVQLLKQSGFDRGRILLMTDHAGDGANEAASAAAKQGFRVDVLGVGAEAGAPYRRGDGTFANARLDESSLRGLASAGNGRYARIAVDDSDLRALGVLDPTDTDDATRVDGQRGHAWQDEGYWLLPPLMLLALFAFRRRTALAMIAMCVLWTPVKAADLWRRADQIEHAHVAQGNEAFRRGDFNSAAQAYQSADSADAHYNRGNALAKAGQYPQAIAAYDEALKRQPGMPDAIANKRAVQAAMQRKPPQGGGGGQSKDQSKQDQKPDQKPQPGQGQPRPQPQQDKSQAPQPTQDPQQDQQPQSEPQSADAQKQREADAAQRQRMQQALQQQGQAKPQQPEPSRNETPQQREQRLANEAWLRRVPDDPGGLLREKFRIEHERRSHGGEGNE